MAVINVEGIGRINIDDGFLSAAPEQQQAILGQIAASIKTPPAPQGFAANAKDFVKSIPGGVVGPSGLGGILSATGAAAQAEMGQPIDYNPTPEQAGAALGEGALPTPQGPAGRVGRTLGGFIAGAPFGPPAGGTLARAGQSMAAGLASGTAGEATAGTPYEGSARFVGGLVGGGAAGGKFANLSRAEAAAQATKDTAAPAIKDLMAAKNAQYKAGEVGGPTYAPQEMGALADHVKATLNSKGSREFRSGQGEVWSTVDQLQSASSVADIKAVRDQLSEIARETGIPAAGRAANIAIGEIDAQLARTAPENASLLETAGKNYGAAKRAELLDQKEGIADLRAARAGYGGNAPNTLRQVVSPIVEKAIKGNFGGFNKDEIDALTSIAEGTWATNAARFLGQFSPSKGQLATGLTVLTGGASGIAGGAANKLAALLERRQYDRLNEMVRKRSPAYAQAVSAAADRYFNAGQTFLREPSARSLANIVATSRTLSSGLRNDGIDVSSGDLLQRLGAGDEQQ